MTEHNLKFLGTIILTSLLVGSYQLPLIENTLNKYGFENNINQNFIYAKNFQQFIEDEKISFSSYLTDEKNTTVSFVDRTNNIQLSSNPVSTSIENNNINNSSGINKGNLEANSQVSTSKSTCSDNCVVLMIGDSVMGDVDFSLQRLIKKEFPNWKIIDGHNFHSPDCFSIFTISYNPHREFPSRQIFFNKCRLAEFIKDPFDHFFEFHR